MRRKAEVAAEHYCREVLKCVRTVRAVKTRFNRQDMFASDVLGKRADGQLVAVQVTTGNSSAVSARKRKLEKEVWSDNDIVQILQVVRKDKGYWFRIWEMGLVEWTKPHLLEIPDYWFKKKREEKR